MNASGLLGSACGRSCLLDEKLQVEAVSPTINLSVELASGRYSTRPDFSINGIIMYQDRISRDVLSMGLCTCQVHMNFTLLFMLAMCSSNHK